MNYYLNKAKSQYTLFLADGLFFFKFLSANQKNIFNLLFAIKYLLCKQNIAKYIEIICESCHTLK